MTSEDETPPSQAARPVLAVCAACTAKEDEGSGRRLIDRIRAEADALGLSVRAVPCFAVCDRPVTMAFVSPGKWSYVIGDVDADIDLAELVAASEAVASASSGVPPFDKRPDFFRSGVIARVPPVASETGTGSD